MHILLVGCGKMAFEIIDACDRCSIPLTRFGSDFDYSNPEFGKPVAIHFGSGRQLGELIDLCEQLQIPIIQGSTKLSSPVPIDRKVVIVQAPNLSLPMIRFLTSFRSFAEAIRPGMEIGIIESHQSKKADTSGTARSIAKALDIPEPQIKSVRDPHIQLALGIPTEHLGGHAYHDFIFNGQGVEIKVSTQIRGRVTYAEGAITLARALANEPPLKNGVYGLNEVFHLLP